MNFKSNKTLDLLMSSAMAIAQIFANTVKAKDGIKGPNTKQEIKELPVPIVTKWHLMNEDGTEEIGHVTTDPMLSKYNIKHIECVDSLFKDCSGFAS